MAGRIQLGSVRTNYTSAAPLAREINNKLVLVQDKLNAQQQTAEEAAATAASFVTQDQLAAAIQTEQVVSGFTSATPGNLFHVKHSLGIVPTFIEVMPTAQLAWWVTPDDRRLWSETTVGLRSDTASTKIFVKVGGQA